MKAKKRKIIKITSILINVVYLKPHLMKEQWFPSAEWGEENTIAESVVLEGFKVDIKKLF